MGTPRNPDGSIDLQYIQTADFKKQMKNPVLIDGRRIYNPEVFGAALKFVAVGLGKSSSLPYSHGNINTKHAP